MNYSPKITKRLNHIRPLSPAFQQEAIVIAFSSSDYFVPYLAVTIQSIIEHAKPNDYYDLVIFHKDITSQNQTLLTDMLRSYINVQIRFVNLAYLFTNLNLYTPGHVSIETYFRLIIPLYMAQYSKILFLDSDLCILEDIANLYHTDIGSCALAATTECLMSALVGIHGPRTEAYLTQRLGLKHPDKYFQAGVMIINIKQFIEKNYCQQLLQMVSKFNYDIVDQDALNELLNEKVYWLPNEWNYPPLQTHMKKFHYLENMSDSIRKQYLSVEKPKILHFADFEKPWFFPSEEYATIWWQYARKIPFYEEIIRRMSLKGFGGKIYLEMYPPAFPGTWIYYKTYVSYIRCKIFSHLLWGNKRQHYHQKMHNMRERIGLWRTLRQRATGL